MNGEVSCKRAKLLVGYEIKWQLVDALSGDVEITNFAQLTGIEADVLASLHRRISIADYCLRHWASKQQNTLGPINFDILPFVLECNCIKLDPNGKLRLLLGSMHRLWDSPSISAIELEICTFTESCMANKAELELHWKCVEDQQSLREQISGRNGVCFVANNSILPRNGAGAPLISAVPFISPPELEETFVLPHFGEVSGMLVPTGVTVITGGGFHGKTTLLRVIAFGVYNKAPGDGREFAVSIETTAAIRAEDGR